jgi:hypothetical protein
LKTGKGSDLGVGDFLVEEVRDFLAGEEALAAEDSLEVEEILAGVDFLAGEEILEVPDFTDAREAEASQRLPMEQYILNL